MKIIVTSAATLITAKLIERLNENGFDAKVFDPGAPFGLTQRPHVAEVPAMLVADANRGGVPWYRKTPTGRSFRY